MKPSCGIKQWAENVRDDEGKREVYWFACSTHDTKIRCDTKSARTAAITVHKEESR